MVAHTIKADDFLHEQLHDPEFKKHYDQEASRLDSAVALMHEREKSGLTQRQLAEISGVPQTTIARIERGANTSFNTMSKIAMALGKTLKVEFT